MLNGYINWLRKELANKKQNNFHMSLIHRQLITDPLITF